MNHHVEFVRPHLTQWILRLSIAIAVFAIAFDGGAYALDSRLTLAIGLWWTIGLVYGSYAKQSAIDLSMGSVGDPWDNALAETFFASLEKELLRRERFTTREQVRMRVF